MKSGEWRARVKVLDHYRKKLTKLFLRADELEECFKKLVTFDCAHHAMEGNEVSRKNLSEMI